MLLCFLVVCLSRKNSQTGYIPKEQLVEQVELVKLDNKHALAQQELVGE